jgi:hypothetical protein
MNSSHSSGYHNDKNTNMTFKKNSAIAPDAQLHLKITKKPFKAIGHIGNSYYFFVERMNSVISVKTNQFKQRYMLKLARIDYWREHFGTTDKRYASGVNWNDVEISLMTECYEFGDFQGAKGRARKAPRVAVINSMTNAMEA